MSNFKSNNKSPHVTKELLDWLERVYPDRCPDASMSDRQVWMAAGSALVARKLRAIYEHQEKEEFPSVFGE